MKLLFVFLISLLSLNVYNIDDITQAIKSGDATVLSKYFDESVEISLSDDEDIYNKEDALKVLDKFFTSNKPVSFDQVHEGTSKGQDSVYCIGNLKTAGKSYRVYVFMKVDGNQHFIQELRFDDE